jgi:hypothetical protein
VVSSDREVADFARAQGSFLMAATEFEAKLRAVPSASSRATFKPLDREEEVPRRTDKKGNPRKLPKTLRKRNRQLRGF